MRISSWVFVGGSTLVLAIGIGFAIPLLAHIGFFLGILWMCFSFGNLLAPHHPLLHRAALGVAPSAAALMVSTAIVYYTASITPSSLAIAFVATLFLPLLFAHIFPSTQAAAPSEEPPSCLAHIASWIAVLMIGLFFLSLSQHATSEASRSPWLELAPHFLAFLAVAIFSLLWRPFSQSTNASTGFFLLGLILFCATSITAVLYPIGYGFDPFIHRATVEHILQNGTITPKSPYYAGQYGLESLLATFTPASVHAIDIWLMPVLASVSIAAWFALSRKRLHPAWLLALPLAPFMNTTPFGLAVLLWLLTLAATMSESVPRWVPWLFALGTCALHPLIGLPALWFVAYREVEHWRETRSGAGAVWYFTAALLLGSTILPGAFALFSGGIDWHTPSFGALLEAQPALHRAAFGDPVALTLWLFPLLIALVACAYAWKHRHELWVRLHLFASLLFVGNLVLLACTERFSFVISYEQNDYLARLFLLGTLSLAPLGIAGATAAWRTFQNTPSRTVRLAGLVGASMLLVGNIYGALPRHDAYRESRGFTVSQTDKETVLAIAQHAGSTPYVVLASQSVSAAATEAFGFSPFYGEKQDVYFYPIPTSGPLYAHFLSMIEKSASMEEARSAMELAGVKRLYFVVNGYWWSAPQALESARETAGDWFSIGDTTVFVYSQE